MSQTLIEKIKQAAQARQDSPEWESVGTVVEVGDGIAKITGLRQAQAQEVLVIEASTGKVDALALNLEEDAVGALVLGDYTGIKSGDKVKRTKKILSIPVGEQVVGRVVDPLGNPLDGMGDIFGEGEKPQRNFLEAEAPSVIDRKSVNTPLHTGIKAIDAMIPIGRGQRQLIIGDRQTGKTAVALDMIINQGKDSKKPPICIYVAVGQKESKIATIVETLKKHNAMKYTVVVAASASSPASFWYLAPFAGCSIGEYFRDTGRDAVIVYDDLSKHAWAWRQISLLLRRPPGREAYPGDVFYLHSRLLERAARLSDEKGGGSLTALPIIETQLNDITAYVPTNVISITDGQIYLESDLFYQGMRPAVNVGLSVSRVGSAAQTKAMKKVAGKLRLELAQFRELQTFMQFASDVDEATQKRIAKGKVVTELLKQSDLSPMPFQEQVLVLYAGLNGYFDSFPAEKITEIEKEFLEYARNIWPAVLEGLQEERQITDELETQMKQLVEGFVQNMQK